MSKRIFDLIDKEAKRQKYGLEMIPSENYVSEDILKANASILTNKYSEGFPGRRYYGGNEVIDEVTDLQLFKEEVARLPKPPFAITQRRNMSVMLYRAEDAAEIVGDFLTAKIEIFQALGEIPIGIVDIVFSPSLRRMQDAVIIKGGLKEIIGKTIFGDTFSKTSPFDL